MTNSTTTVTFSAPEQYQRAIDAYAILNGLKRSEACRQLLHDILVQKNLLDPNAPIKIKAGRPKKATP